MPFRRRRPKSRRRSSRRGKRYTAAYPRMMGRGRAKRRFQQVDNRLFWFKYNNTLAAPGGDRHYVFQPDAMLYNILSFQRVAKLYDEFKVLGFKLKLFPADVGIESGDPAGVPRVFRRGNVCIWNDQRTPGALPPVTNISQVINNASARLISARRPYARSIWRPYGTPNWTSTEDDGSGVLIDIDPWSGSIQMYIQDATITTTDFPLWFTSVQFKVLFRGRKQDTP